MHTGNKKIQTILLPCRLVTCKSDSHFQILVDMITGEIITEIEEYHSKKIPNLSALTQKQIKLLQLLHKYKKRSEEQLIKELGDFNIIAHLKQLVKHGYVQLVGDGYSISQRYIFTKLEKAAFFKKLEYEKIEYDTKLEGKVNIDKIKEQISRFTDVTDTQDCFLVRYQVENGF